MAQQQLVDASLQTDQGRVRSNNQDFVAWREPSDAAEAQKQGWLYILADGAGGMDAGEVASRFATERTLHHYLKHEELDWGERLQAAMQAANVDLREMSARHEGNNRMATTMVAVVITDDGAHIANVGDSRAYYWHQGALSQITKDQSLVAQLVDEGAITEEEAAVHPRRNVILFSLGSERTPRIDLFELALEAGDRLMLCSDGLTRHVSDEEIESVLGQQTAVEAAETLISLANERGGQDNISVGVLHFQPDHGTPRVVPSRGETSGAQPLRRGDRVFLSAFTFLLAFIQTIAIVFLWLQLRY
jgi:protein phosphatase